MILRDGDKDAKAEARAHYERGLGRLGREAYKEAADSFLAAIKLDENSPDYHSALGDALHVLGQSANAVRAYTRSLELAPGNPEIHHKLGYCQFTAGEVDDALESFKRAIKHDGTVPAFHDSLGDVLREIGRRNEALSSYKEAASLDNAPATVHLKCVELLAEQDAFSEAIDHASKALAFDPNNTQYRSLFADMLFKSGDFRTAAAEYEMLHAASSLTEANAYNLEYCYLQGVVSDVADANESGIGATGVDASRSRKEVERVPVEKPAPSAAAPGRLNFVWLSLEQGMQSRAHYFQYAIDHVLHKTDLKDAIHTWGATTSLGPGNFHLPDHLDAHLSDFIAVDNMYTSGTSTVPSVMGGFTGIPHGFHALVHVRKTEPVSAKVNSFPTLFDILRERGYSIAGFHIFKETGPGFILPDFGQGHDEAIDSWPNPFPSHVNYIAPVARLENYLKTSPAAPHAICLHMFAQTTPAALEILAEHGINRQNTIFVIVGDHGHPNWDLYGKEWMSVHDLECDDMNTHVYCRFSYPGCRAQRITMACTTLDFFPTIMNLLGIPVKERPEISPLQGTNLLPYFEGRMESEDRVIRTSNRYHFQLKSRITTLRDANWRYQYMHKHNVFLHKYHRLNDVMTYARENLYRNVGNGFEGVVHIDNPRVSDLLYRFRRLRIMSDATVQRFWLENLREEMSIPEYVDRILDNLNPLSNDLVRQIELSERFDAQMTHCIEEHLNRPTDLIGEIKRMVEPDFYYNHVVPTFSETVFGKVAVWDVSEHYARYVRPILRQINACFFIDESDAYRGSVVDGLPVYGPDALLKHAVDVVLICSPPADYASTIARIRSMDLPRQPLVG